MEGNKIIRQIPLAVPLAVVSSPSHVDGGSVFALGARSHRMRSSLHGLMNWATHVLQSKGQRVARIPANLETFLSSNWGLQLAPMKMESIAIANQDAAVCVCTRLFLFCTPSTHERQEGAQPSHSARLYTMAIGLLVRLNRSVQVQNVHGGPRALEGTLHSKSKTKDTEYTSITNRKRCYKLVLTISPQPT